MGTGRARAWLARTADVVPLTARGAVLLLACALALRRFALVEGDLVIRVLATTGLALVALSSSAVCLGAVRLRAALRAHQGPRRLCVEVGRAAASGFTLPRLRGLLLLNTEIQWLTPAGVECEARARRRRLEEWILPRRRFEVGRVQRRIALTDALGLARVAWEHDSPQLVVALPATGIRDGALPPARAAGDDEQLSTGLPQGDRLETRPYQAGEPSRHILWRSWARSRELFVRTPERSAASARRVAAYLVCGPGDEPAAGAARAALESGALGTDWLLGADGCPGDARGLDQALVLLARSAGARGATRLACFTARAAGEPGAALLVFAPARPGPWVEELERVLRARAGDSAIVLAVDPAPAALERRRSWLAREPRAPDALEALRVRLACVARVAVIERSAGAYAASAALADLARSA